jgi:hypothetical protein
MLLSQFSAICANFGEKNCVYLKTNVVIAFLQKLGAKTANIFAKFFGENIFKIITSVPGLWE